MKTFFTFCLLLQTYLLSAQLKFETKFYDAVNKWVLFDSNDSDNDHILGFIYIDPTAGYTLRYYGLVIQEPTSLKLKTKSDESLIIHRLANNTSDVYVLNDKELNTLNLKSEPDNFEHYKINNPNLFLLKQGSFLNGLQLSKAALKPLEELYLKDKNFKGLAFELGFAYNALGTPEKGIDLLESYLKNNNTDYWAMKELLLAYVETNELKKAEDLYNQLIKISPSVAFKTEITVYIAKGYLGLKDKQNFDKWISRAESYANGNKQIMNYIEALKNTLPKD
ncbi:MAG TPA: hypothetical protein DCR77_08030 [Flavobacteriaceae bacterium]|nr:hypothetical protein [Flavobacteriaceae bacterium]